MNSARSRDLRIAAAFLVFQILVNGSVAAQQTPGFKVLKLEASFSDDKPVIEAFDDGFVSIATPLFRVNASVECVGASPDEWYVGLIQVVTDMYTKSFYRGGFTEWAMPYYPIADSDGESMPWYDRSSRKQARRIVMVSLTDTPTAQIGWAKPKTRGYDDYDSLSGYVRSQRFLVWLAAFNVKTREIVYLKELEWGFEMSVRFDCRREPGFRAVRTEFRPLVLDVRDPVRQPEGYADYLEGPWANEAQSLYLVNSGKNNGETRVKLYP